MNRDILLAFSPAPVDQITMGCLADAVAGPMVPGHRSDGSIVGARLLHNAVGNRSPSATMADIALALDFDVSSGVT